ncbi:MAG: hypothetical protein LC777_07770 [Actinobacteria bacterium]|nr:hypothetical protein [Actinomycetota bacterium]
MNTFVAECQIEPLPRERGFVRVTMPSGETLKCQHEGAKQIIANHFKRTEPRPVIPTVSEPPRMPSDDELLEGLAAAAQTTRRVLEWTARLTTQDADTEVGSTPAEHADSGPPPRFVTETLNALTADGWAVHHVGEDHAMVNESAELVRVRYLLVAS